MNSREMTVQELFQLYPVLTAEGLARRAEISPQMMRAYKAGAVEYISATRKATIEVAVRALGAELQEVRIK